MKYLKKNRTVKRTKKGSTENMRGHKMDKFELCKKIIQIKACQICALASEEENLLLCDQCDDAYHWICLNLKQQPHAEVWICPSCSERKQLLEFSPTLIPEICFKCGQKIQEPMEIKYFFQGNKHTLRLDHPAFFDCLTCKEHYHRKCFHERVNTLNCQDCERKIREEGPKNHSEFINYLRRQEKITEQMGFLHLVQSEDRTEKLKRASYFGLKVFQQLIDWDLITRFQASLYYAIRSRNLIYTASQVYESKSMMQLNNSSKQFITVHPLSREDEVVYEIFRNKIKNGAALPIEIKQDRKIGFYIVASKRIQRGTILFQYGGQVNSHSCSLKYHQNDSIFSLLVTGRSKQDLNIVSEKFGNASRFVCGVNNQQKKHLKRVNLFALRFSFNKRIRVIFISKKQIQRGERLYLDYNAGAYEEYPTSDFI